MEVVKFVEGVQIYLRPIEDLDTDLVYFGKNNSLVRETLFLFKPITQAQIASEFQTLSNTNESQFFTICLQENNIPIGQTALVRIDYISRAAIFYIAIYQPEYWGKSYGKEATQLMLKYAFDILNLNRVQLHVSAENTAGIRAYEKAGFVKEGVLRQAMYHNNEYVDFYVMGILRKEYYDE